MLLLFLPLKSVANILSKRRERKFQRDKIDLEKALNSSNKILQQLMNDMTHAPNKKQLKEKLLEGQKMHPFEPLNLQKSDTPSTDVLKLLCRIGPSFVPVLPYYNWLQLQKDFDKLRNSLRSRVFFANKEQNSNNNFRDNNRVNNLPKKKFDWSAPKTNSPELKTFLTSVERDLFCNTKPNDVKDNLSEEERSTLKNWRKDVLYNKESELVMRLEDKDNRFVIVDKKTGKDSTTQS